MKVKVTCILLLCSFVSLFYVMYITNTWDTPYMLIGTGSGNASTFTIDILMSSLKNTSNQISRLIEFKDESLYNRFPGGNYSNRTIYINDLSSSLITKEKRAFLSNKANGSRIERMTFSINKINDVRLRIGILIPSSTRNLKNPILEDLTLVKTCIPSIYTTMEKMYEYVIYIGIDKGDYLETVLERLEKFNNVKIVVSHGRTFTKCVNAIARKAYQDGMDYFVRINDDSSFQTNKWTSEGIKVLNKYSPMNIGVVGPTCHQGNTAILTHDMVHRTHLEIFDFYYPPYFDNWWADDWITKVYSPDRSTKLSTWVVKHHISAHGTRYNVDHKKQARLVKMLAFDTERLTEYISNLK